MKTLLKLYLGFALLLASQACTPLAPPATLDPNAIGTAIAGTRAASLAQTAQVASPTATPVTPTVTRAPTWTPFATYTVPVVAPRITVSVNTNCRKGPGKIYDRVGSVLAGQSIDVVGRSVDGKYWVIRNPDRAGVCWISDQYVVMSGLAGILPILTSPPRPTDTPKPRPTQTRRPPTATFTPVIAGYTPIATPVEPSFAFVYLEEVYCPPYAGPPAQSEAWWLEFQLDNTGGVTFQSLGMIVRDTTAGIDMAFNSDGFVNRNHCPWDLDTRLSLEPAGSRVVSSPILAGDPSGHSFDTVMLICSDIGLSGDCVSQAYSFTVP